MYSIVHGDKPITYINQVSIHIPINCEGGNVTIIYNSACSSKELKDIGPSIRSDLPYYERKIGFVNNWSSSNFENEYIKSIINAGGHVDGIGIHVGNGYITIDDNICFNWPKMNYYLTFEIRIIYTTYLTFDGSN